ncbi:MAG TPA: DUF4148 domain-containing protein [Candidatus Binataceae bacterium]
MEAPPDRPGASKLPAEQKKPWYRKTNRLLALAAFVISVLTFVNSQYIETHRSKQQQLRQVLSELIELRKESRMVDENPNYPHAQDELDRIADSRFIYLESAQQLIAGLWLREVSSAEFDALAYDETNAGNYDLAKRYLSDALEVNANLSDKSTALQLLGDLLFRRFHDAAGGRQVFDEAAKVPLPWTNLADSGLLYETWGADELDFGERDKGIDKIKIAIKYFCGLPEDDTLRKQGVDRITRLLADHHVQDSSIQFCATSR